ncbi:MAG: hypothetical protein HRT61_12050 [Ekhidna sp.]|nr:hypothetical protein [Ekhidna sp.]
MRGIYTIRKAYHWTESNEVEISSDGLIYAELGDTHYGVQCMNQENEDEILKKCKQIADLIREVDKLNQTKMSNEGNNI